MSSAFWQYPYNYYQGTNYDFCNQFSGGAGMANQSFGSPDADIGTQIRQKIEQLKASVTETSQELDRCKQEQEAFTIEYRSFQEQIRRYEAKVQQVGKRRMCGISGYSSLLIFCALF